MLPRRQTPSQLMKERLHCMSTLSLDISGDPRDKRAFHYFRCRSVTAMSGYLGSEFWETVVLQLSHAYPTVRHAILALGSFYEHCEESSRSGKSLLSIDNETRTSFALQQYNKAVNLLKVDLSTPDPPLEGILASCLIFICLEFLQNNAETALTHLKAGTRILNQFNSRSALSTSTLKPGNDVLGTLLPRVFRRLHTQALIHGNPNSDFKNSPSPSMPCFEFSSDSSESFTNLDEARFAFEEISGSLFQFIRQIQSSDTVASFSTDPASAKARQNFTENYLDRLVQWNITFEALVSRLQSKGKLDKSQQCAMLLLRLHHRTVLFPVHAMPYTSEMVYDKCMKLFEEIVCLAEMLIEGANVETAHLPVLSVDYGVIAPLYIVAFKCREQKLRQRALSLLKRAPAREGIWQRHTAVGFTEWKMNREEQAAQRMGWLPGQVIPQAARIFSEKLTEDEGLEGQKVTVVTYKRNNGVCIEEFVEVVEGIGTEMGQLVSLGSVVGNWSCNVTP
jgi:hypothetical protein